MYEIVICINNIPYDDNIDKNDADCNNHHSGIVLEQLLLLLMMKRKKITVSSFLMSPNGRSVKGMMIDADE
ncbi:hypothetical protein DPMN_105508 [Dreissena polymorpha]|uniref:Uncharacterized protein n=1 Tax=Dreissena polymorpha TaxID=45954 RepID=A0A9D4K3B4_DREPO|nr:hypothetical protein DPMN_105508 [Dreissena polymorpha]